MIELEDNLFPLHQMKVIDNFTHDLKKKIIFLI